MPNAHARPGGGEGPAGRLEVICGPMFAGKTTALIAALERVRRAGETCRVWAFKPALDGRYHPTALASHAGGRFEARAVEHAGEIEEAVLGGGGSAGGERDRPARAVVGIDEAHFFGAALVGPVRALVDSGCRVVVAGLERDHRGEPFEPMPALLCEADAVTKLVAACARCGGEAVHTQRLVASGSRIVVGGAGMYEPRCRACFRPGGAA